MRCQRARGYAGSGRVVVGCPVGLLSTSTLDYVSRTRSAYKLKLTPLTIEGLELVRARLAAS